MTESGDLQSVAITGLPAPSANDWPTDKGLPIKQVALRDGEFAKLGYVDGSVDIAVVHEPTLSVVPTTPTFAIPLACKAVGLRRVSGANQQNMLTHVLGLVGDNPAQLIDWHLGDSILVLTTVLLDLDRLEVLKDDCIGIGLENCVCHMMCLIVVLMLFFMSQFLEMTFARLRSLRLRALKLALEISEATLFFGEFLIDYQSSVRGRGGYAASNIDTKSQFWLRRKRASHFEWETYIQFPVSLKIHLDLYISSYQAFP